MIILVLILLGFIPVFIGAVLFLCWDTQRRNWHRVNLCVDCSQILTSTIWGDGVCPYCGHVSAYSTCLVDVVSKSRRWKDGKWEYRE